MFQLIPLRLYSILKGSQSRNTGQEPGAKPEAETMEEAIIDSLFSVCQPAFLQSPGPPAQEDTTHHDASHISQEKASQTGLQAQSEERCFLH